MKKSIIFFIFLAFTGFAFGMETVKIRPKYSPDDATHKYYVDLLQKVLDKTEKDYRKAKVEITDVNMTQGRSLIELENERSIDVDWAGTDIEREKRLEAVRVPLMGGLLGYRVLVIRKADKAKFDKIKSLNDLKKFTAIQGTHWPDSDILENAKLSVLRVAKFELMYDLLENGRGDYFPRALNEAYSEMNARNSNKLMVYDRIIIAYKFPMYFFTAKSNKRLAARIEKGLKMMINDGSFLEFIKTHEATRGMFPLDKYKKSLIFYLNNPLLPKETPVNDKKLWINLK